MELGAVRPDHAGGVRRARLRDRLVPRPPAAPRRAHAGHVGGAARLRPLLPHGLPGGLREHRHQGGRRAVDEGHRQVGRVLLLRRPRQRPSHPPRPGALVGGARGVRRRVPGQRRVRDRAARPAQREGRQPRHDDPQPDLRRRQDAGARAARPRHERRPVRRHHLDRGLPADRVQRGPEPLRRAREHADDDPARARRGRAAGLDRPAPDVARGGGDVPLPGAAPLTVAQRPAGLLGRPAGAGARLPPAAAGGGSWSSRSSCWPSRPA